ncbi:Dihydroneopterin aldolase [Mucinivorans hirudinis]|uniref:7,8-dihydroneopterin aldolase n=1 Tax=Mucinivorans hirudinis TaxID=1433126 RepID=A0A060RBB6_9BACT|nr:Dihydroneopterin aldolase [Mucinivorans hirudinis]
MIAKITLENIELYAFHGCYEQEQRVGNRFRVDIYLTYDAEKAAKSDNVADTINYLRAYEIVREQMLITSHILENVVDRILTKLGEEFAEILRAEVRVAKLAPPLGGHLQGVSVTMERNYSEQ